MVALDEIQGIIEVSMIHPQGTMTINYMAIHPAVVNIFQS